MAVKRAHAELVDTLSKASPAEVAEYHQEISEFYQEAKVGPAREARTHNSALPIPLVYELVVVGDLVMAGAPADAPCECGQLLWGSARRT